MISLKKLILFKLSSKKNVYNQNIGSIRNEFCGSVCVGTLGKKKEARLKKAAQDAAKKATKEMANQGGIQEGTQGEEQKTIVVVRPSVLLNAGAEQSMKLFTWIGEKFAIVSSFYTHLQVGELLTTLYELVSPIVAILASPLYIISGYRDTVKKFYDRYSSVIKLGSFTIFLILGICCYKYPPRQFVSFVKSYVPLVGAYVYHPKKN